MQRDGYRSTNPPSDQYPPPDVMLIHWLGAILPHTKRTISTEMIVPDMIAPVLDNCSIINVEFYFTVRAGVFTEIFVSNDMEERFLL